MDAIKAEMLKHLYQTPEVSRTIEIEDRTVYRQMKYINDWSGYPAYQNTATKYYKCGEEMFPDMISALEQAQKFVFMEYYIIEAGYMLYRILEILERKVQAGVDVRLIYDDIGSIGTVPKDFAKTLDKPLVEFIKIYRPAYFERVGLRYLNFISRKQLGLEDTPFRELIQPQYLGLLADESVAEQAASRSTVDAELAIRGGCRAKIHAGPGLVKHNGQESKEVHFIFDQDLFMPGNVAVHLSAGALETLHSQAFSIFRGAITETLHDAMEPIIA
jgi:hypothetical protein